jgi:glycyl-tRNA synthetase
MSIKVTLDKIVSLCKRRGFVWQNSEIYGGMANLYDFGPYGVLLENNIKKLWLNHIVRLRDDIFPIDGMVLMHPKAWEASGHVSSFTDPLVDCKKCKKRFRADQLDGWVLNKDNKTGKWEVEKQGDLTCPECEGEIIPEVKPFNLLMETYLGSIQDEKNKVYLKGESCQNIYLNYALVRDTMRAKLPFGIAQIGKAFRNEITAGKFIFRLKEFEQMDLEYYTKPEESDKWFKYWKGERFKWYTDVLRINKKNLKWHQHPEEERIFYAKDAWDIFYNYPQGFKEIEGIHHRSDYDCKVHSKASGKELDYFDQETKKRFYPYIIETSVGVSRIFMALICDAYREQKVGDRKRVYLRLDPKLAPIKAAIFPLQKDKKLVTKAKEIYSDLKQNIDDNFEYDKSGSIGKRYRRQDEIGTPFCITVDFESLDDNKVTIRDRDTLKQERVNIDEVEKWIKEKLK